MEYAKYHFLRSYNERKILSTYILITLFFTVWQIAWIKQYSSPGIDEVKHLTASREIRDTMKKSGFLAGIGSAWRQSYDYPPLFRMAGALLCGYKLECIYYSQLIWLILIVFAFYMYGKAIGHHSEALIALVLVLSSPGILKYLREFWPDGAMVALMALAYCGIVSLSCYQKISYIYITFLFLALPFLVRQTAIIFTFPLALILLVLFFKSKPDLKTIFHWMAACTIFLLVTLSWYLWSFPKQKSVISYHSQAGDFLKSNEFLLFEWLKQLFSNQCGMFVLIAFLFGIFLFGRSEIKQRRFIYIFAYCLIIFAPVIVLFSIPNHEYRFSLPIVLVISVISASGYRKFYKKQSCKFFLSGIMLLSFGYMLFITYPSMDRSQRVSCQLGNYQVNIIFGPEMIFQKQNPKRNIPKCKRLFILQPAFHLTQNWRISEALMDINEFTHNSESKVLWLASNVKCSYSVASLIKDVLGYNQMQMVNPWPTVDRPVGRDLVAAQDSIVIGPIHRVCYNIPWGDKLRAAQQQTKILIREMNFTTKYYRLPGHQTMEVYFNLNPIKRFEKKNILFNLKRRR